MKGSLIIHLPIDILIDYAPSFHAYLSTHGALSTTDLIVDSLLIPFNMSDLVDGYYELARRQINQ